MKNANEYYKATQSNLPSELIRKFFSCKYNEHLSGNTAIDLGCGAGNDTEFLISKGFKVTAVDSQEEVRGFLDNKIFNKDKLDLIIGDFSKIDIPNADLIMANMSLFFIKDNFAVFLKCLLEKVNNTGFFIANFLGKEDDWNGNKTTLEKEELLNYFKEYKIEYFSEEKYFKDTARGVNKFWHVYTVIAQKLEN